MNIVVHYGDLPRVYGSVYQFFDINMKQNIGTEDNMSILDYLIEIQEFSSKNISITSRKSP